MFLSSVGKEVDFLGFFNFLLGRAKAFQSLNELAIELSELLDNLVVTENGPVEATFEEGDLGIVGLVLSSERPIFRLKHFVFWRCLHCKCV